MDERHGTLSAHSLSLLKSHFTGWTSILTEGDALWTLHQEELCERACQVFGRPDMKLWQGISSLLFQAFSLRITLSFKD